MSLTILSLLLVIDGVMAFQLLHCMFCLHGRLTNQAMVHWLSMAITVNSFFVYICVTSSLFYVGVSLILALWFYSPLVLV